MTSHRAEYQAAYYKNWYRTVGRVRYQALRAEAIRAYGGRCICCGENGIEFLAIDHVNNDGKQHRASLSGGAYRVYAWLKERGFPEEGFQVLCHNCNFAKGWYGHCPHRRLRAVI